MHPLKTTLHSLQKQSAPLATPPKPSLGIPRAPIHHHSPLNHRLVFPVLHHHIRCPTPCQSATADPPTDALQLAEQYGLKIDLALTLAACAFEAYNTPINVDDAFVERTVSGTETTFLDKDYLLTHVQGVLIVHLQSATQLDAKDFLGKSDPYAVISVGPSAHRSATIPNTLDPEWDERFFLFVRDAEKQRLLIKVNDEDFVGEDDPLGSTMRGLGDVVDGEERVLDLELVGGGKGRIKLSIQYLPMTGALLVVWGLGETCARLLRVYYFGCVHYFWLCIPLVVYTAGCAYLWLCIVLLTPPHPHHPTQSCLHKMPVQHVAQSPVQYPSSPPSPLPGVPMNRVPLHVVGQMWRRMQHQSSLHRWRMLTTPHLIHRLLLLLLLLFFLLFFSVACCFLFLLSLSCTCSAT